MNQAESAAKSYDVFNPPAARLLFAGENDTVYLFDDDSILYEVCDDLISYENFEEFVKDASIIDVIKDL